MVSLLAQKAPDQAARRDDLILTDQHGREVHVVFDTRAMGAVIAYPRFNAPWVPDLKYLRYVYAGTRNKGVPVAIQWDYEACLRDTQAAWERWFGEFRTLGMRMPGVDAMSALEAAQKGEWHKVPPGLLLEVGETPDPLDYVKAALAENKWVLGLSQKVPTWAEPLYALKEHFRTVVSGVTDAELDKYRDEEEAADPEALGGKVLPVRRGRPPKGPAA